MKFEIKNRFTGHVQFTCELDASFGARSKGEQLGEVVKNAYLRNADLSGADLSGADLSGAYLRNAYLRNAYLRNANLGNANLYGAYLGDADLGNANLRNANLGNANLSDADLSGAYLGNANLYGAYLGDADLGNANLSDAYLSGAYLRNANLSGVKADLFAKLLLARGEVLGLYDYLMKGKIDGVCYEGECACFVGTIAKVCGESFKEMKNGLKPDTDSPTEKWFLAIKKGDIPQNNQVSAITAEWLREFMDSEGIIYPKYEIVRV